MDEIRFALLLGAEPVEGGVADVVAGRGPGSRDDRIRADRGVGRQGRPGTRRFDRVGERLVRIDADRVTLDVPFVVHETVHGGGLYADVAHARRQIHPQADDDLLLNLALTDGLDVHVETLRYQVDVGATLVLHGLFESGEDPAGRILDSIEVTEAREQDVLLGRRRRGCGRLPLGGRG